MRDGVVKNQDRFLNNINKSTWRIIAKFLTRVCRYSFNWVLSSSQLHYGLIRCLKKYHDEKQWVSTYCRFTNITKFTHINRSARAMPNSICTDEHAYLLELAGGKIGYLYFGAGKYCSLHANFCHFDDKSKIQGSTVIVLWPKWNNHGTYWHAMQTIPKDQ